MTIRCLIASTPESEAAAANGKSSRQFLLDSIALASRGEVELVSEPRVADVILFAEWHGDEPSSDDVRRVLSTPLFRQYRTKTVIHSGKDDPTPLIPGLYPSLSASMCRLLACQGAPYLQPTNPYVNTTATGWDGEVDYLASFVGAAAGKPVRLELIKHATVADWRDILVRDTHAEFVGTAVRGDKFAHSELKHQFAVDLLRAKFALCPAGTGLSSFRIYEAMKAGRAPVVIADGWSAPPGPNWNSFLIRIQQRDIKHLPALLRERASEWKELGAKALNAWETFYKPDRIGTTIVQQAYGILSAVQSRRTSVKIASAGYVYCARNSRRLAASASIKIRTAIRKNVRRNDIS